MEKVYKQPKYVTQPMKLQKSEMNSYILDTVGYFKLVYNVDEYCRSIKTDFF